MVKNRKPMFVSEDAHNVLLERAKNERMFMGDVVDVLLGVKHIAQVKEENKYYFADENTEVTSN